MHKRGLLIRTDATTEVVEVDDYRDMQEYVGGYIELAPLDTEAFSLYCNEEGKINGLAFNALATVIADLHRSWKDPLMGDVLLLGPVDNEGDDTDLPPELIKTFQSIGVVTFD